MKLNNRVQLPGETVIQYRADIELLCVRLDPEMSKSKLCAYILKGLNPAILQQVATLDNTTLQNLAANIKAYERTSYMMRKQLGINIGFSHSRDSHVAQVMNTYKYIVPLIEDQR